MLVRTPTSLPDEAIGALLDHA